MVQQAATSQGRKKSAGTPSHLEREEDFFESLPRTKRSKSKTLDRRDLYQSFLLQLELDQSPTRK